MFLKLSENGDSAMLIINSYSLAVSDGTDSAFSGLKKKKKKPVRHFFQS